MAPPKQKIEISPAELVLDLSTSTSPSATLTLKNVSDDENLLYKVRTTNPKRYLVKPNQEVLLAGASVTITIQMQSRECQEILDNGATEDEAKKDKFMISTVVAEDTLMQRIKAAREKGSKELQAEFGEIWNMKNKDDTANRRIAVDFLLPKSASSVKTSDAGAGGSSAKAAVLTGSKNAEKPEAAATSMTGVAAAQIQTPNKKAEQVVEAASSNGSSSISAKKDAPSSDTELSYETLAKQYKETLATLVQVTEERDRFQQKFRDMSRELVQMKDDARSTPSKSRAGGTDFETLTVTKPGYQIWHLALVAMVSFLVAKLMELARV